MKNLLSMRTAILVVNFVVNLVGNDKDCVEVYDEVYDQVYDQGWWMQRKLVWVLVVGCVLGSSSLHAGIFGSDKDVEAELVAGRAALEDGFYDLARTHLEAYIDDVEGKDNKAAGVVFLARCLVEQEKFSEALKLLDDRGKWARGSSSTGAFAYWKARARLGLNNAPSALGTLAGFKERFPGDAYVPRALRLEARTLAAQDRMPEAITAFAAFDQTYGESPEAAANLLDWAEALQLAGEGELAVATLNRLMDEHPDSAAVDRGRLRLGEESAKAGNQAMALELLGGLTTNEDADPRLRVDGWLALATMYEDGEDLTNAVAVLAQAAAFTKDAAQQAEIRVREGGLRIRAGEVDAGFELLRQAVIDSPIPERAAEYQLYFGELLQAHGMHERAVEEFQNYLEAFAEPTGQVSALWAKGWSLWELARTSEAATVFEKAYGLTEDPELRARALFKMADAYLADAQYQNATSNYVLFAQSFPDHELLPQAYAQQAEAMARGGDAEGAHALLQKLTEENPDSEMAREAMRRQALLHEHASKWEEAVKEYTRIIETYPESETALEAQHRRGIMRYRLGQFQAALADFKPVSIAGGEATRAEEAFYMQGWSLYMMGQSDEALAVCQSFIQNYPDSPLAPRVLFWLGEYHWNRGEFAEAETQFLAYAERAPQGELVDKALFWAGRSAARQSSYARAMDHAAQLVREQPESPLMVEVRLFQGDVLTEQARFSAAILAFEEIIENWPSSYLVDRAWGRKGDCQFTLGTEGTNGVPQQARFQEALTSYRTVYESTTASADLKLQALYKTGRCLEKMGREDEAFEAYMKVVYEYVANWSSGDALGSLWFTRAAFSAAGMMEAQSKWDEALKIYKRVADAGLPASKEARKRMQKLRLEHWVIF